MIVKRRPLQNVERLGWKVIELRAWKHAQPRTTSHAQRWNIDEARRAGGPFIAEGKPIASRNRPTALSAETAQRVRGTAAQVGRNGDATAERDVGARARAALTEAKHTAGPASHRSMQRNLLAVDARTEVGAGDGDEARRSRF